jgi:hypothetical protein
MGARKKPAKPSRKPKPRRTPERIPYMANLAALYDEDETQAVVELVAKHGAAPDPWGNEG